MLLYEFLFLHLCMNTLKQFADGLTWEVERSTPYTKSVSGLYIPEDGYTALKRDDNGQTLYITRKTYTETKNSTFME